MGALWERRDVVPVVVGGVLEAGCTNAFQAARNAR